MKGTPGQPGFEVRDEQPSPVERLALVLGVAGATVLGAVAALLFESAEALGRGAAAERVATEAAVAAAAWRAAVTDMGPWFTAPTPGSELFEEVGPVRAAALAPVDLGDDALAYAALLDRARRARISGRDLDRAGADLDGAAGLARGPVRAAEVALERLRLASVRGADRGPLFNAFWSAARPGVLLDGQPAMALAVLLAASDLTPERRAAVAADLARGLDRGALALPWEPVRWADTSPPSVEREPRAEALTAALVAAVDQDSTLGAAVDRLYARSADRALAERVAAAGWTPGEPLSFAPDGDGFWVVGARAGGSHRARYASVAELGARLRAAVAAARLEPSEFRVGLGPGDVELGSAVGAPIELAGLPIDAQLRHPDPAGLTAGGGRRARVTALALSVLAILTLTAGWSTRLSLGRRRRLAALRSRWIAAVSHELRTPVTALALAAGRLERTRIERPDRLPQYHELLRVEAERLERLVAQVMDIARIERGQPPALRLEVQDLGAVLDTIVERARQQLADRGFALAVEAERLPRTCVFDALALGRAVENLVENAARHSGGSAVTLGWRAGDGTIEVTVRDDGRGLPEDARLFEAFHRGEGADPSRGVGLGLGIARELMRAHGGDLVVDRSARAGAAFRLTMPLRPGPASAGDGAVEGGAVEGSASEGSASEGSAIKDRAPEDRAPEDRATEDTA